MFIRYLVVSLMLILSASVLAKDKEASIENAIRDEIRDEYDDNGHKGDNKGKGRPDNPGEHGRDNAAQKQKENPGQGSKGDDSWEKVIRDELEDDEQKGGKNKNNKKN